MGQIKRQRAFRAGCIRAMSDEQWFAVAARANRERAVERLLANKNYQVFLPVYRKRYIWSDRLKELVFPARFRCRRDRQQLGARPIGPRYLQRVVQ
jgi:hypothetical protein